MQIQKLLKYSPKRKKYKSNNGFTLVELLISSVIGVLVIGAAGYGLMNLLRNSRSSTAQIQQRNDLNRAIEFVSDEMKRAETIEVDPSDNLTGVTIPTNGTAADAVLALNIPGIPDNTDDTPIVYFLSSPPDDDIWQGPKVIYRYGPPLDEDGNFTNGAWDLEPLVDGISDDDVTASCDTGWTATPTSPKGFYACIQPTVEDINVGETAQLFAIGDTGNSYGKDPRDTYQASTKVFARAEEEELEGSNPDETYTAACDFTTGILVCPPGSNIPRTYNIENLGSALARNPNGDLWSMVVSIYSYDDSTNPPTETLLDSVTVNEFESIDFEVETDLPIIFKVKPDTSNLADSDFGTDLQNHDFVSSNDSNQFKLLDADLIEPALEKSYQKSDGTNQKTAKQVLSDNNLIDPVQPNKINLKENQHVIAFEVGQTDPNHPGYDTNDQLLLVTVSESESE